MSARDIAGIACSVVQPELQFLQDRGDIAFPFRILDSDFHMRPDVLETVINNALREALRKAVGVVIIYGDCHIRMNRLERDSRVVRVDALNCCDMLLGRELYKKLMRERCFFLFPEWTARWKRIVASLDSHCASRGVDVLRDTHDRLVYLDTGVLPIPRVHLDACSCALGLSFEILSVPLDNFRRLIAQTVERLDSSCCPPADGKSL